MAERDGFLRRRARSRRCGSARIAALALLASGALMAAPAGGEPAATVEMTNGLQFDPREIRIPAGSTVEWRNTSMLVHTVTADPERAADPSHVALPTGAESFDSGRIDPGGRYRHTFPVAGRYRYFCVPHEANGMVGEILVEERAGPAPSP